MEEFAAALHHTITSRTVRTIIHLGEVNAVRLGKCYFMTHDELERLTSICPVNANHPASSSAKSLAPVARDGLANAAVKYAVATRKITHAPIVTLPEKGAPKDRWLTKEEAQRLLEVSAPHVQRSIKITLYTGRRKTAITRLRWMPSLDSGWVDLDNGVILFLGKAETETKKRKGVVRMRVTLLEEMKSWAPEGSHVVLFKGASIIRIDKAFRAAARRVVPEDVTPHTLQHTAVTWAFMRGMTLEDATAYFSTSREILENVYRSYSPDALRNAAGIMDLGI